MSEALIKDLRNICSGEFIQDTSLSDISRWKVGGAADLIIRPKKIGEVAALRKYFNDKGIPNLIIGATSNLLFADEGLRAVCLQIGNALSSCHINGKDVFAEAGVWVPGLARKVMLGGLTGAEHICGIPGTLGGLICMNGGSQRKGIGSSITSVTSVDAKGEFHTRSANECDFGYRKSVFQSNHEVIVTSNLSFDVAVEKAQVRSEMLRILRERRRKFPQKLPNCGSVFKSNPSMYEDVGPPGLVIERLGFKGFSIGGALVSPAHSNFIINDGNATAADVLALIKCISEAVYNDVGYAMEVEASYVDAQGVTRDPMTVI